MGNYTIFLKYLENLSFFLTRNVLGQTSGRSVLCVCNHNNKSCYLERACEPGRCLQSIALVFPQHGRSLHYKC